MSKNEIKRNPASKAIADLIFNNYKIESAKDIQEAVKDAFAPLFERMLETELESHLGYSKSSLEEKETKNRRNGYIRKRIKTSVGEADIKSPRDRDGTFEPIVVPKHKNDVTDIEDKVLAMYARGMSQRDISATINDIYGFKLSQDKISTITDLIVEDVQKWQDRPLKELYTFVFVDCIYVKVKNDRGTVDNCAVYILLGIDIEGKKEVLGIYGGDTESKTRWLNIFDKIKERGVKDILFLSMDGVSGLEEGVKAIYPETVVQRCIVHLIRNSVKYIPSKHMKEFCKDCKSLYGAVSLESCENNFIEFKKKWADYPGAVKVWENNFIHIVQLFSFPSDIRRIMYTTNAIESVNSSLRKVTKKGMFENMTCVFKIFYLRITRELAKKWDGSSLNNWSRVLNQLAILDSTADRVARYI